MSATGTPIAYTTTGQRMRLTGLVTVIGLFGLLLLNVSGGSATAAGDTTRPTLNLPARATFVAGTSIGVMEDYGDGWGPTHGIQMTTSWSASDPSGICGYRFRPEYGAGPESWSAWGSRTSISGSQDDYVDQDGGGQEDWYGYSVQARDCAGNVREKFVAWSPAVLQQDGQTYSLGDMAVASSGTWRVSNCLCWSGGTAGRTSESGASITFSDIRAPWGWTDPRYVALVMETAPDRGKVAVYIDTQRVAVVDTYAATKQHRTVVWVGRWPTGGGHTLSVVNQATPGRPRIDLDAVLAS